MCERRIGREELGGIGRGGGREKKRENKKGKREEGEGIGREKLRMLGKLFFEKVGKKRKKRNFCGFFEAMTIF